MENIKFRTITANDAEALYRVKIAAFSNEFEQFKYAESNEFFRNILEDIKSENPENPMFTMNWHNWICKLGDNAFVIEDGTKIIGSIFAMPGKHSGCNYSGYDLSQDDIYVIKCVYVLPEYKNKGVGKAAMEYMESSKPAKKWILDTPDVSIKNKSFYEKCGYKAGEKTGPNNLFRIFSKGF